MEFTPTAEKLLPDLTPREELVLLARALWREGYNDHLAGHITIREGDTLLCNPWLLTWAELRPEHVIRIDLDGNVLEGDWPVPLGIPLHLELHKLRDDVHVAMHSHPLYGTVWADMGEVPPVYDQSSGLGGGGDLVVVDEYGGGVDSSTAARDAVLAIGGADLALLAGHGVFVLGTTVRAVHQRAVALEQRCQRAWHIRAAGGRAESPVPDWWLERGRNSDGNGFLGFWEAMARVELAADPRCSTDLADPVTEEHRSFCRICSAACGIVVTTDGELVVKVRGDAEHPLSRGYTCSKARGLPAWHHGAGRLDRPRVDGRDAAWDDVLDDLSARLGALRTDHGADAIGLYLATGLAYDAAGQAAAVRWLYGTGSTTFYSAATVDNAPVLVAAELVAGHSGLNPVWEPGSGGPLLVVGCNPVVSHGYGTTLPDPVRHLRDHRRSGGRIWVVDPRRTETAALADHHLRARPGSDVELLAFLARGLLVEGHDAGEVAERCRPDEVDALRLALAPFGRGRAVAATGLAGEELDRLLAELRGCDRRLAVFCGTGTTMARDGVLVEWLRWVLLVLTGSLDRPGGMRFNRSPASRMRPWTGDPVPAAGPASRPDLPRVAGQVPVAAMVDEIEAGHLRGLVVTGGNPLAAFPEPDRVRAALESLAVLAVLDVAESELTSLATHVLPATGQLERADVKLNEAPSLRVALPATRAVVAPVADRRPSWWIMAQLGRRLGVDLLDGADPDEVTDESYLGSLLARSPLDPDEVFAAGPHGREVGVEHGWVRDTMLPEGRWRVAPSELIDRLSARTAAATAPAVGDDELLLVPRREMAWSNSVRYAGEGAEPELRLHPDDATRRGLRHGARSTVASADGEVVALLAVDPGVRPGTASMTHGRGSASPGVLTSSTVDVDPLTTMPLASGLAVTVTPA